MNDLINAVRHEARLTPVQPYQRLGYVCGLALLLSGVAHGVVYLVVGGPWEGPISWRKPIVFGLSFGITVLTLTWFLTFLRPRHAVGWVVSTVLSLAAVGEVFLITMQKWRGVPSHFNDDTAFDTMVFSLMGLLVALVGLAIVYITLRSFFAIHAPPSLAWAIRLGLVLMLVSQAVGAQMIAEGGNTFGAAGALKVPHAFTLHAAQVLPALALMLSQSDFSELRRVRVVVLAAAGYTGLIAATMVQTYGGRGPLDLGPASSAAAVLGLGLLAASALMAVRGVVSRSHGPAAPTSVA